MTQPTTPGTAGPGAAPVRDARERYRGRFAPSPTGPLHLGSLVAALGSWLDARSHDGNWLIRIENIDPPREQADAARAQLALLARCGMESDEPIVHQSERGGEYEYAVGALQKGGLTYHCDCSRSESRARQHGAGGGDGARYDGTCRGRGLQAGALRLRTAQGTVRFVDRACGPFEQDVAREVGDFVLRRADGLWSYQLAVVADDAMQRITDVVRGADLLDNTPRQILLQRALGLPTPRYLHLPLVRAADGRKLSKADQAPALRAEEALAALEQAAGHLALAPIGAHSVAAFQRAALAQWRERQDAGDAPAAASNAHTVQAAQ